MIKVLIICGPTATGKTRLAVQLAKQFDGELVSADSRQVYRGMDIATGKDISELSGTRVWLIDVVYPDEEFSVSHYVHQAAAAIVDIHKRNKLPIIVGGTGLYIKSLIQGLDTIDIRPDIKLRQKLKNATVRQLQRMLDSSILEKMNSSDKNNPRRLIRKIEIGRQDKKAEKHDVYDALVIGLTAPKDALFRSIDARVKKRVAQGVKREIRQLLRKGYSWDLPSMQTLGIKEWKPPVSDEEAITRWTQDEHSLARRQMTWFTHQPGIHWFDVTKEGMTKEVEKLVGVWYT